MVTNTSQKLPECKVCSHFLFCLNFSLKELLDLPLQRKAENPHF